MTKKELVEKFKSKFPELKWKEFGGDFRTQFACSRFEIEDDYDTGSPGLVIPVKEKLLDYCIPHLSKYGISLRKFKEIMNPNEEYIWIDSIDPNIIDLIMVCLRDWVDYINTLRSPAKGSLIEDQLVLIHPDWDIEYGFEDDFEVIVSDDDPDNWADWRLGVMSTEKWDFGKDELKDELNDNSGDCFCIWEYDEEPLPESEEFSKLYENLKKVYPDADKVTKVYSTDFD